MSVVTPQLLAEIPLFSTLDDEKRREFHSDRGHIDQGGDGRRGNPASAIATPGQVVRRYQVFPTSYPG